MTQHKPDSDFSKMFKLPPNNPPLLLLLLHWHNLRGLFKDEVVPTHSPKATRGAGVRLY